MEEWVFWKYFNLLLCFICPAIVPITFRIFINKLAPTLGRSENYPLCTGRIAGEIVGMIIFTLCGYIPGVAFALWISIKRENAMYEPEEHEENEA